MSESDDEPTRRITSLGPPGNRNRRRLVRHYFRRTPDPNAERQAFVLLGAAAFAVLVGVALVLVALPLVAAFAGVAAVMLGGQGWIQLSEYRRRLAAAEPKPLDGSMDRTLQEDLAAAAARAMARFRLGPADLVLRSADVRPSLAKARRFADQGDGPLVVFGPAKRAVGRSGAGPVWRFSAYDVLVVCPTEHHLALYGCTVDLATGAHRDDQTHEYHYGHVVAILTTVKSGASQEVDLMDSPYRVTSAEQLSLVEFQVVVASGDRSRVVVGIDDDDPARRRLTLQESGIEDVVDALRETLRRREGAAGVAQ
ncbi:hypothetical protein GCM10017691_07630 [Pseudonocardia petroleophila]|uniref:DUF3137 domain-containing protein n=1 Tax=Pseudonocardia petroleophila TaxID=37331 RepID=A0A7G7MJR6_9PSEU|nr:hypothetical protein [Pseudonocardia petroleophila]QNG53027.1 hypothetical protein H6H00_03025 [Pseudonocardia petroleophila]